LKQACSFADYLDKPFPEGEQIMTFQGQIVDIARIMAGKVKSADD